MVGRKLEEESREDALAGLVRVVNVVLGHGVGTELGFRLSLRLFVVLATRDIDSKLLETPYLELEGREDVWLWQLDDGLVVVVLVLQFVVEVIMVETSWLVNTELPELSEISVDEAEKSERLEEGVSSRHEH